MTTPHRGLNSIFGAILGAITPFFTLAVLTGLLLDRLGFVNFDRDRQFARIIPKRVAVLDARRGVGLIHTRIHSDRTADEISLLSSMFERKMIAVFLASVFSVAIITGCASNLISTVGG